MHFEVVVQIDAPVADVWSVLADVERWPEWTKSVDTVTLLDAAPLRPGSRAVIKQPRLRPMTWTVTELTSPSSFTWEARVPGLTLVAGHQLVEHGDRSVEARLVVEQGGPLGLVLAPFTSKRSQGYVELEAEGLKARSESS